MARHKQLRKIAIKKFLDKSPLLNFTCPVSAIRIEAKSKG